jgi:hypothetical protein
LLIRLLRNSAFVVNDLPDSVAGVASFFKRMYLASPRPLVRQVRLVLSYTVKTIKVCVSVFASLRSLFSDLFSELFQRLFYLLPSTIVDMYKSDPIRSARTITSIKVGDTVPPVLTSPFASRLLGIDPAHLCPIKSDQGSRIVALRNYNVPFIWNLFPDGFQSFSTIGKSLGMSSRHSSRYFYLVICFIWSL